MKQTDVALLAAWIQDALALLCIVIMFLAGNDVWHDAGRPDFWRLDQPPFPDVRAFVIAYYALAGLVLLRIAIRLARTAGKPNLTIASANP